MSIPPPVIKPAIFCVLVLTSLSGWANSELQLTKVVNTAIGNDPWLRQSARMQEALIEESYAEGALPDLRVTIGAANLPTDTFDTGQEAMTQATIGFSQRIPRGDSRQLASEQKTRMAEVQPFRRENRREQVTERVTHLWLELWRSQESIRLIESNRGLFEQLSDVAEAGYTSAIMGSRQQDIIRASLELTRLEDRLAALNTQLASSRESLGEWIGAEVTQLPVTRQIPPGLLAEIPNRETETDVNGLIRHPSIRATDQLIDAQAIDVDLARQAYKPEWSVFAQYGYRDRTPNGQDRADLFSVGIGFDLPIFTGNRQDRKLRSSTARLEAARSGRILQMRELQARARAAMARIEQLDDRIRLYRQTLIPQMEEQASAALTAYDSDDGDFAEAVRARIDELNARVELIQIVAERAKNLASFRYLTAHSPETTSSSLPNDQD